MRRSKLMVSMVTSVEEKAKEDATNNENVISPTDNGFKKTWEWVQNSQFDDCSVSDCSSYNKKNCSKTFIDAKYEIRDAATEETCDLKQAMEIYDANLKIYECTKKTNKHSLNKEEQLTGYTREYKSTQDKPTGVDCDILWSEIDIQSLPVIIIDPNSISEEQKEINNLLLSREIELREHTKKNLSELAISTIDINDEQKIERNNIVIEEIRNPTGFDHNTISRIDHLSGESITSNGDTPISKEKIRIISDVQILPPRLQPGERSNNFREQTPLIFPTAHSFIESDDSKDSDFICDTSEEEYILSSIDSHSDFFEDAEELRRGSTSHNSRRSIIKPIEKITKTPIAPSPEGLVISLSEETYAKKLKKQKLIRCRYCDEDIFNKNFTRHLQRQHANEKDIKTILDYPKGSKKRRQALILFGRDANFDLYINGETRPSRKAPENCDKKIIYYPCVYCNGVFAKDYLRRHVKFCMGQEDSVNKKNSTSNLSLSQTLIACSMDPTEVISKLNVKKQVFDIMRGDEISLEAKKDLLIAHYGESYLKKHKREGIRYACSNRMRELSRLLIEYRKIVDSENVSLKDMLLPKNFDNIITAVRKVADYDPFMKTFKAPSLAMHLGTSMKLVSDELVHLIIKESKGFQCRSKANIRLWIESIKDFKNLVETRWSIELASLASKDLQEKKWSKPLLVPLVSDIKKFRDEVLRISTECCDKFRQNLGDKQTYKMLVQTSLSLLIIFNRRRIGDIQFLKIQDYRKVRETNFTDFENTLTETEKMLTKSYKRILNSGKGSRAVVILLPEILEKYIDTLLDNRAKYIPNDNEYVFAVPDSKIKWGKGDVAIRTLTRKINLENPQAISSNSLRKHIATVMQMLNLSQDEAKQFSSFMGHTQKTHDEFYELPVDIYQTAKVSKILLMMEKGSLPLEYKGKSLAEIDINIEYPEESEVRRKRIIEASNSIADSDITLPIDDQTDTDNNNFKNVDEPDFNDSDKNIEDEEISNNMADTKVVSKKIIQKRKWTSGEIKKVEKQFSYYIKSRTYPPLNEINKFLETSKSARTAAQLKSKIQHLTKIK